MSGSPDRSTAADPHAALASPVRRRLLELLRAADTPRDATELANGSGLHVTTVRFHLDVLRRAGLVLARPQPRATAGRPRTVYAAASNDGPGPGSGYAALAELLAAALADSAEEPAARAERAGAEWAMRLVPPGPTVGAASDGGMQDVGRRVTGMFAQLGFDPELRVEETRRTIRLRACPFRDVARAHPEVVCSVHLGLLRGTLT